MKKIVIVLVTMFCFASSVYALPSLQLGPGNTGDWSYDWSTETWVTDTNPFSINAYANAKSASGGNGDFAWDDDATNLYAYLVISAIPKINIGDGFDVSIVNDGVSLVQFDSGFGSPPIQDPNDLAPHSIFETYFEIYQFVFNAPEQTIYDTQPGQTDSGPGFVETFNVTINSLATGVTGVHMDLFTVSGDGSFDATANSDKDLVNAFAPFAYDAQAVVAEPTTLLLVGSGLIGFAAFQMRVRKR